MSETKPSVLSTLIGTWNRHTVAAVAVGALLFGVLMNYGSVMVFTNTTVTTAMILDVVVGALFGPLPAAVMAFLGNVVSDLIAGWGFWFDWSVGNAVLALFIGMFPFYGAKITEGIFEVPHAIIYALTAVVGNLIAFGMVTPILTYLLYNRELSLTWSQAWAAVFGNAGIQIIIGIPLLFLLARRSALAREQERKP